ncbi:MAG: 50S ribosomal protein L18 [Candidatus Levybacteria bacterium CG10_big_fil_rev_8_21_14_0_10_35_13]|nr:MAG: 50S ribosomal protein L18 [Candidatus Levybacteria bacterium CG10_big_fil_rev_8_21_14_0_10_35_13]
MKNNQKISRQKRVRIKTKGTSEKPRLSVYRSNKYIYAQVIDDEKQKTIAGASQRELSEKEKTKKIDKARQLGLLIAKKALSKKISNVVFDRGSYKYHGRIKAVAEGAREGGLKF